MIRVFFLFVIFHGFQFLNAQSCYGNHPIYYTKMKVYIYQNMSSESAIKGEIPSGESVKVIDSFFGDYGYWKICFGGISGWVKKSLLSYRKTTTPTTDRSNSDVEPEVGFEPFLGQTTNTVNFRKGPSSDHGKISVLSAGANVYVYSKNTINSYYKAIDVGTNQIGWVHKNYVVYVQPIEINENGAFQSTGYISSYDSEITVNNKSSYTIKLVVEEETFELNPHSIKNIKVKPGRKYYIASAPGVIPASGYQSFESNNGYEWEFWVQTTR
ncbi:SH3 domain-containing protein [Flagellimonas oceanensis]|uniref:SH3 domain-containing protein n=1 Tax=Flagellimonas oceanensis TaxID=2499163 RepID=UPI000F8E6211|nr:SH3 domain-containing protein [Allomuricauda oceanensis]